MDAPFFQQIRDAAIITENGRIVDANVAANEQFGYGSLIGMPVAALMGNPEEEREFVRLLLKGPVTDYASRMRCADGEIRECLVTATPRFDDQGNLIGCHGLVRDVTERNRIIAGLRRAEQDYRGLFEHAHDAILILDPDSEIVLDVNDQACRLYGYPREEFIGRSMIELSTDPERGKTLVRRTREEDGRYSTFESRQIQRGGTIIDVEINAAEVSYRGGRAILSINRDVSARRRAEAAVRASETRFRLLIESVTDYAIVMLDPAGNVASWNDGAQRITGYTEQEVLGRSGEIFALPEDRHRFHEQLEIAVRDGRVEQRMTRLRKGGSHFEAAVTLTRLLDEKGDVRGFASITHDITLSVQLEQAREQMLEVYRDVASEWTATFDAVQVPIVLLDGEGRIRRLNRVAQMLAGEAFQKLIDQPLSHLQREPWQTMARVAREAFMGGNSESVRVTDGESVWQVSASIDGSFPAGARVIAIAYDLTVVSRLEASLRRSELTAALGSVVAGVAHEVRNPLFTISATLDAWEARYSGSEGVQRYGGAMREQVHRLTGLMHDLLEYGKPNPLVIGDVSLVDVLRAAAADCAAIAEKHSVEVVLTSDEFPPASIDATRLEQVFQNVIDNAIRQSPAGTKVSVYMRAEDAGIVCRITDEGGGIGREDPEMLFVPFYTRRRGGTGLGLSIARNITALHGGEIRLANRDDGRGAVATIILPLSILQTQRGAPLMATGTEG